MNQAWGFLAEKIGKRKYTSCIILFPAEQ